LQIALRVARIQDFDYCASLYFGELERIIRELNLDLTAEAVGLRQQWDPLQVRIITLDGTDVGWLQVTLRDDAFFLAQLFVEGSFQRRGIGTEVIDRIIGEATRARRAVTLGVVKTNPALRLYQRLGFRITREDDHRFYMRRDPNTEPKLDSV
jgi:ribosomal protein S18 acetylase RimI-like enzyme